YAPDSGRGYRALKLPDHVDAEAVARNELRWWVVRREVGLAAGAAAGDAITELYASLYDVPREHVAEAGRRRGIAAEVRDRGATDDPDGPRSGGAGYWAEDGRLLRDSYRSLSAALAGDTRETAATGPRGRACAAATRSTPPGSQAIGRGAPATAMTIFEVRGMTSAPATVRTRSRARVLMRSHTRMAPRTSAIVRPRSAALERSSL